MLRDPFDAANPLTPKTREAVQNECSLTEDGRPNPEYPGGLPDIYATIGEIVAQKKKGRESDRERIVAIPIGMAICDVALAQLVHRTASEKGIGQRLNLM